MLAKKYGECVLSLFDGNNIAWPRYASMWWKEVVKLGDYGGREWFNSEVDQKVGNGLATSFWNDRWRGEKCFRLKHPRLYSVSNQKDVLVGEMREASVLGLVWRFHWRRHLFMWDKELLLSLREDLEGMVWSQDEDVWRWRLEDLGVVTVKSAYNRLEGLVLSEDRWREDENWVFKHLWKVPAPNKVVAFAWKVLLNRILRSILLCVMRYQQKIPLCVQSVLGWRKLHFISSSIVNWLCRCGGKLCRGLIASSLSPQIYLFIGNVGEVLKVLKSSKRGVGSFGLQRYGCCGKYGMITYLTG